MTELLTVIVGDVSWTRGVRRLARDDKAARLSRPCAVVFGVLAACVGHAVPVADLFAACCDNVTPCARGILSRRVGGLRDGLEAVGSRLLILSSPGYYCLTTPL